MSNKYCAIPAAYERCHGWTAAAAGRDGEHGRIVVGQIGDGHEESRVLRGLAGRAIGEARRERPREADGTTIAFRGRRKAQNHVLVIDGEAVSRRRECNGHWDDVKANGKVGRGRRERRDCARGRLHGPLERSIADV